MDGILIAFLAGAVVGGGLFYAGVLFGRRMPIHAPILRLADGPSNGSRAVNAQIPLQNAGIEPVYLTESQIARMARDKSGSPAPAHPPVEADRL